MTVLRTVAVAFSMFSALPMPRVTWDKQNMRYALCAFPLVGALCGGLCWCWSRLCVWLVLPAILRAAGLCLLPVLITGGIHLDGYADTCDALASHAPPEKKQEILKDPHVGAFAAIRLCCYFVATLALYMALPFYNVVVMTAGFCLSRALSGLAVASFPLAKDTGLVYTFAAAADKKRVGIILSALSAMLCVFLCFRGPEGIAVTVAAAGTFLYFRHMVQARFGGLSGDLSGWFLQTAELWMLAAMCAAQYMEALL